MQHPLTENPMFIEVHGAVGEEVKAPVAEPRGDLLDRIAARAEAEGISADEWAARTMELFLRNGG